MGCFKTKKVGARKLCSMEQPCVRRGVAEAAKAKGWVSLRTDGKLYSSVKGRGADQKDGSAMRCRCPLGLVKHVKKME